jgi:cytochrome c oxidase subunit II
VAHMRRVAFTVMTAMALAGCASAPSMLDTHGTNARDIAGLWWLMIVLAAIVFVIVTGLVVVAALRRRRGEGTVHDGENQPRRDDTFIALGGLLVPALILSVVAVYTVRTTNALDHRGPALDIHVVGERWWWRVSYPSEGVTTANEIHIPAGRLVDITLTSSNVIHSFWVPQLSGKVDLIPGQTNHLRMNATEPGTYRGQCAEFCGIGHARMAFFVIADAPSNFDAWVAAQQRMPASPSDALASTGAQILATTSCAGCHTVAGTQAQGTLGPDLTHVGSRTTLAAGTLPNTPDDMAHWLQETQSVKPGALMPELDLTTDQIRALVAYLEGLR